jgi:nicotinate-nucleotide pyrophosphorylase (carboxylating)
MQKLAFSESEREAARRLIDLALAEDLGNKGDLTCEALIDESQRGTIQIVARQPGVLAGIPIAKMVFEQLDSAVHVDVRIDDGSRLEKGSIVADVSGPLRSLLIGERTALNFLTHLSGIATFTRKFVDEVAGTRATILDTRKTLPGYRALAKYAVRCGGGSNHRMGLYDGCLIKDNHLAAWGESREHKSVADAVRSARQHVGRNLSVEVEVDSIEQLVDALAGKPDIVLLDNMSPSMLKRAVEIRDQTAPAVQLEASGGVNLSNVAEIARTGVDRISVGALTHSAVALDLAFDWKPKSSPG